MEQWQQLKKRLETERPTPWDGLPDILLYMDQVLSYLPRQHMGAEEGEGITSAMVNNYVKEGLLPRAEGKRYSRTHLGYLTAISALKQVLSVRDMQTLIRAGEEGQDPEKIYDYFLSALDQALSEAASELPEETEEGDLPKLALAFALRSYADRLACQRIIAMLRPREPEKKKKK